MIDIKLPVKWLREKGVGISYAYDEGDHNFRCGGEHGYITSFAWRVGVHFDVASLPIEVESRPLNSAKKWKPDDKALMEMYTAEQSAKLPPETKKENKLKLTKDDVGKEFEIGSGSVFKSLYFKNEQSVLEGPVGDLHVCDSYGYMDSLSVSIIKRHEPRYWLKDLPDADAFSESVSCIACNSKGWYVSRGSMMGHFITNKMPELTPNDYDSSEMAIMDLRVWQRENK